MKDAAPEADPIPATWQPILQLQQPYRVTRLKPEYAELLDLLTGPPWERYAACKGLPRDWFFPDKGVPPQSVQAICRACPVRQECLDDDLAYDEYEIHGYRGGMNSGQRQQLAKRCA